MDIQYFDEMHRKSTGGKGALYKTSIIFACIAALFIATLFIRYTYGFGSIVYAGIIYGAYILIRNSNEEYEYIFTDGEVDIDVIRGRSRRKRMVSLKPRDVELMAKATGGIYESYKKNSSVTKHLNFSDNNPHNQYFIVAKGSSSGKNLILVSPSERLINAIKPYLREKFK